MLAAHASLTSAKIPARRRYPYGLHMKAIPTPDPPLQSESLLLRRWRSKDALALFTAFTDPDVLAFSWAAERAYTQDDAAFFIRDTHAAQLAGRELQLAIVDAGSDRIWGCASVHAVDHERGNATVGYWLVGAARGQGLATRAVMLLSDWAFAVLGLHRLELTCAPDNLASQAVARRAGFQLEGRLRSHTPFKGARRDTLLHSLLPGDRAAQPDGSP